MAEGQSNLVIAYPMLRFGTQYSDSGRDFFDRLHYDRLTHYHVTRLESLGHNVMLVPTPA